MNVFNVTTGKRVLSLREKAKLTREELGEMAGISDRFIYDIETGRKGMSAETVAKLADALCVTTDYILNGTASKQCTNELYDMLSSFNDENRPYAENLLRTFANAINNLEQK